MRPLRNYDLKIVDCRGLEARPRNDNKTYILSLREVPILRDDEAISGFSGV